MSAKAPLLVKLVGNWLVCIPLVLACAGIALWLIQSGAPPLFAVVPVLVIIALIRTRSRLSDYQYFEEQWVRTAGGIAPPRKRMSLDNLLLLLALGGAVVAFCYGVVLKSGARLFEPFTGNANADVELSINVLLTALLAVVGLLVFKLVQRRRLAKRRRLAAERVLDGKPLPNDVVTAALGVPRSSPSAASFTQALPDYCKPLLDVTVRRLEDASHDGEQDAITDTAPTQAPPRGGFLQTLWQWGQVPHMPKGAQYALGGVVALGVLSYAVSNLRPAPVDTPLVESRKPANMELETQRQAHAPLPQHPLPPTVAQLAAPVVEPPASSVIRKAEIVIVESSASDKIREYEKLRAEIESYIMDGKPTDSFTTNILLSVIVDAANAGHTPAQHDIATKCVALRDAGGSNTIYWGGNGTWGNIC